MSSDYKEANEFTITFQQELAPFYHPLNIYTERIAPSLAKQCQRLWEYVRKLGDEDGFLDHIKSHYVSQAVIFNGATHFHKDHKSCWSGFDAIGVFGKYSGGELGFPSLGYSFSSHPSDLFFIRGAALEHGVTGWEGDGRMVISMFADRRVFTHEKIPCPQDLSPLYGQAHKNFHKQYQPLMDDQQFKMTMKRKEASGSKKRKPVKRRKMQHDEGDGERSRG